MDVREKLLDFWERKKGPAIKPTPFSIMGNCFINFNSIFS